MDSPVVGRFTQNSVRPSSAPSSFTTTITSPSSSTSPTMMSPSRRRRLVAAAVLAAASNVRAFSSSFLGRTFSAPRTSPTTGLHMMFDQLSSALSEVAQNFGPKKRMTEQSIKPALRQVRRALLDADVNLDVADALIEGVKKRTLGQEVIEGVSADQQFIKAMYDELLDIMGGDSAKSTSESMGMERGTPAATLSAGTASDPTVILLAGLQGAGKTTAAGKLAKYLQEREVDYGAVDEEAVRTDPDYAPPKRQRKVLLVAADVYRPAAIQQLEILGERVGVEVFSRGTEIDPVDIAQEAVQQAKEKGYDTVLIDTAGRQVVDSNLMDELKRIQTTVKPSETLLVVDAMTGQEAASLTAAFDSAVGLTGAILTKLDGDSRGGAAVSVLGVSGKPIKFVGTGETMDDLEPFFPDRMASRILGMGDVVSLVEKAAEQVSAAEAKRMQEKMQSAEFDFDDFMKQAKLVANMGSLANVAKMMPGMAGKIDASQIRSAEDRLKKNSAMIASMTKKERARPELLITDRSARSRLNRISQGSGMSIDDARMFLSEFQRMRTMMSRMSKMMGGEGGMEPGMEGAGAGDMEAAAMASGNRAMRRMAKKKNKAGRGGGGGFGR